jgi:hypothetical protein
MSEHVGMDEQKRGNGAEAKEPKRREDSESRPRHPSELEALRRLLDATKQDARKRLEAVEIQRTKTWISSST